MYARSREMSGKFGICANLHGERKRSRRKSKLGHHKNEYFIFSIFDTFFDKHAFFFSEQQRWTSPLAQSPCVALPTTFFVAAL
jgi:hypothetical protein